MKLCSSCAIDHAEYYFYLFPFSRCECECCKEFRLCFDVNTDSIVGGCLV